MADSRRPAVTVLLLAAIVCVGALLRFATLGTQSFWLDEAYTYGIVAHGLGHVLASVPRTESTPPLYYLLSWLWSRIFGLHEVGLRSFSAVCGVLTIPVVWAAGRQLVSERVGVIAAALTAVNPLLLWYSQEARSYALLVLLSALTMLALVGALQRPTDLRVGCWGVVGALDLCTHYYSMFLIVPEAAWLVVRLHRDSNLTRKRIALSLGPIVAMGIALAPLATHQSSHPGQASGSLAFRLHLLLEQDVVGYYGPAAAMRALTVVSIGVAGLALWRQVRGRERTGLIFTAWLAAGAIAGAVLAALLGEDYLITRNMLEVWPALAIALAVLLGARRMGGLGVLAIAAIAAIALDSWSSLQAVPRLQRADWRGAEQTLGPPEDSRALVSYGVAAISLAPYIRFASYPETGVRIQEIDVLSPVGSWLGATPAPLYPAAAPPGFAVTERVQTTRYALVRYRAQLPLIERATVLEALYPGLASALVLLQRP